MQKPCFRFCLDGGARWGAGLPLLLAFLASHVVCVGACRAEIVRPMTTPAPASNAEGDSLGERPAADQDQRSIRLQRGVASPEQQDLRERAAAGDSEAMLRLGYDYYRRGNNQQNYAYARRWFQGSADGGDPRGMLAAGYFAALGLGGVRDLAVGRDWLSRAIDVGLLRGKYILSLIEGRNPGTKKQQEARRLLEEAAAGDAVAQNALAVALEQEGDLFRSRKLYENAAQQGSSTAAANLDRLRQISRENKKASIIQLQAAAADGDAEAIFILAQHYHKGQDTPRHLGEAMNLYTKAAALGHKGANEMVAMILSHPPRSAAERFDADWMMALSDKIPAAKKDRSSVSVTPKLDDPLDGLLSLR